MSAHVVVTEAEMAAARQAMLAEACTWLTPREMEAFDLRLGLTTGKPLLFREVAQQMGIAVANAHRTYDHAESRYCRGVTRSGPHPPHRQYLDLVTGQADAYVDDLVVLSWPRMYSGVDNLLPPIKAAYLAEHERLTRESGGGGEAVTGKIPPRRS